MKYCSLESCNNPHSAKSYCNKHYLMWYNHGDPLYREPKKVNEFTINGDTILIHLKTAKGVYICDAVIDFDDKDNVLKHYWCWHKNSYPIANVNGKVTRLHRFLLDIPKGMFTDHINRNKYDNRRSNLRICTPAENSRNRASFTGGSQYKGVCYYPNKTKPWVVNCILPKTNKRYWGAYKTELDAARKYNELVILYGDEFSYLNILPPNENPLIDSHANNKEQDYPNQILNLDV